VWVTIAVFSFQLLGAFAPYVVLGPTVAQERYGDAALYGWLAAAVGFGTAIGSLIALRWRPARPVALGIVAATPFCLMLAAFAAGVPLAAILPLGALTGIGVALFGVWWQTALAERIPPRALSRVTSYDWMGSLALLPIGYVVVGVLAQQLGARGVMAAGGLLAATVLLLGLAPRETRELGREPAPQVEPAAAGGQ
jgi:MFS family permease